MLRNMIRKISNFVQIIFLKLIHLFSKLKLQSKGPYLIDEIKVQLEWCLREVMEKYPRLTFAQAEEVLEMFYQSRFVLIQEGWRIIDGLVKKYYANKYKHF